MTAERRIQRLRQFSTGERGPYDGIAADIACVLEALSVAALAHDMMRACLGPSLKDCDRLDKLERLFPRLAAQVSGNAITTPTLRAAIDDAAA